MPTCKKYFDELADCLLASDCVKINKKKPTDCLASLLKAKVFDARLLNDKINHLETDLTKFEIEDDAPRECKLKHQSYVECKVSLMNPRTRFRGAYGSQSQSS
jgi:hypothetical protein